MSIPGKPKQITLRIAGFDATDDGKLFVILKLDEPVDGESFPTKQEIDVQRLRAMCPKVCVVPSKKVFLADVNGEFMAEVDMKSKVAEIVFTEVDKAQIENAFKQIDSITKIIPPELRTKFCAVFAGKVMHSADSFAELDTIIKNIGLSFTIYTPLQK